MRTAPRWLLALMLVSASAPSAWAVDTIPDVRTLADLRRLPLIHTHVGYDVRVGLADPGPEAGPWRLIYCLATPSATPATQPIRWDGRYTVGPLGVDLVSHGEVAMQKQAMQFRSPGNEWLTCQSLPVGWADDVTVRVRAGATTLLERPLGKSDRREPYWGTFAIAPTVSMNRVAGAITIDDLDGTPWAACPAFSGVASLLASGRPDATAPDVAPLPGSDALAPAWRQFYMPRAKAELLTLSLDNDRFLITPAGQDTSGLLSDHLLARWWVNGKPVPVPDHRGAWKAEQSAAMEEMPSSRPRAVRFGLPAMLGPLKAGDTVGLQLLWVEQVDPLSRTGATVQKLMHQLRRSAPPVPVPTNRLDFTLTAHLLSIAGR